LAAENPDWCFPEVVADPCFEAEALGHPVLSPQKRVCNDVSVGNRGHALLITGSNMAGKSTLLRAMGLATVLALAGAPVCAKRLRVGSLRVATSMRVRDSLEGGASRFFAELLKLKQVLKLVRQEKGKVLFLLDEILSGTNTRERIIGAQAFFLELLQQGALGAVSTHDLALAQLEGKTDHQIVNVHFQEQIDGDTMTFDYKLRPGVVASSNALKLMAMVGLDVLPPQEPKAP
jgi:DNA mismatch repair ATPase MutS